MSVSPYLLIKRFRRSAIKFSTDSMPKCALFSIYISFDMAPNILYTILFIVNCNECLSAEFIGQTSVPYKRMGKHFDLINSNNTSSDALRPIFPNNMLLKDLKNPPAMAVRRWIQKSQRIYVSVGGRWLSCRQPARQMRHGTDRRTDRAIPKCPLGRGA